MDLLSQQTSHHSRLPVLVFAYTVLEARFPSMPGYANTLLEGVLGYCPTISWFALSDSAR
jgi:hypothetical protein